jgi:hypothetical protein
MSTTPEHDAAPVAAPTRLNRIEKRRHIDGIDQPARPLGTKRQALQTRRANTAAKATGQVANNASIAFDLHQTANGLLVERTQSRVFGACLVQMMLFMDLRVFERWCDAEPSRFDDPMRFSQLRRDGHEALCRQR